MKFHQIPIGTRFEFEGVVYVKSSALTANRIDSGAQRVIPRSAALRPIEGDPVAIDAEEMTRSIPLPQVRAALRELVAEALKSAEEGWGPAVAEGLRGPLEEQCRRIVERL